MKPIDEMAEKLAIILQDQTSAGLPIEPILKNAIEQARREGGEDVAIKVVLNGPDAPQAVDDLILGFDLAAYESEA